MMRKLSFPFLFLPLCLAAWPLAGSELPEITNLEEAKGDPDFLIQGEYTGDGVWSDESETKMGAQVIAWGKEAFSVVLTKGGLPGDGWKRDQPRFLLYGRGNSGEIRLFSGDFDGKIVGGSMEIVDRDEKRCFKLKKIVRHSPTEGIKPPEGAIVLFDGSSIDNFHDGALTENNTLRADATTKQGFSDYTLHIEFRLSYMPHARGQKRSNSGVYLHDCYEIQVLDSFGLEGEDNECGGFYKLRKPDVNMCYPPLCWQTYDVEFRSPKYEGGKKTADALVEVLHNGAVIHPCFDLTHSTPGRLEEGAAPRPIHLQGHGNRVEYRNIWLKEKN